jgi:uncharacterized GH25 family protein
MLWICMLLFHTPVFAHDVWLTTIPEGNGAFRAVIHHGHPGDRKNPDPDKLFELDLIRENGNRRPLIDRVVPSLHADLPVLISKPFDADGEGIALVAARYDNGFWIKTAHGYRNTNSRHVQGEESLSSLKYAKALVRTGDRGSDLFHTVVGHRLELVPLDDPFLLSAGSTLRIRVFFDGTPLAGAEVEAGDGVTPRADTDIPRFKTDAQGVASIPLRGGPQLFAVDHTVSSPDPDLAVSELHNATLAFELPPRNGP